MSQHGTPASWDRCRTHPVRVWLDRSVYFTADIKPPVIIGCCIGIVARNAKGAGGGNRRLQAHLAPRDELLNGFVEHAWRAKVLKGSNVYGGEVNDFDSHM